MRNSDCSLHCACLEEVRRLPAGEKPLSVRGRSPTVLHSKPPRCYPPSPQQNPFRRCFSPFTEDHLPSQCRADSPRSPTCSNVVRFLSISSSSEHRLRSLVPLKAVSRADRGCGTGGIPRSTGSSPPTVPSEPAPTLSHRIVTVLRLSVSPRYGRS